MNNENTFLSNLPWSKLAQSVSTKLHKKAWTRAALWLALSGLTFWITNTLQDDIVKYLRQTSESLNVDWLTAQQLVEKSKWNFDNIKKTNSQIANASQSIDAAVNIFNSQLLPQIDISNKNSQTLIQNAKTSILHFQNQIDQTSKRVDDIDKILTNLEKRQSNAPISQKEIDDIQWSLKNFDLSWAVNQTWKSISDWFSWNAVNLTVWDTISQLRKTRQDITNIQNKYIESKNYFEKIIKNFENLSSDFNKISTQISNQISNIDTKNLTISNSSEAITNSTLQAEKFYSQTQISNIIAKSKIEDLIKKIQQAFWILNLISITLATLSGFLLVWHHRNNLINQRNALMAILVSATWFLTPTTLTNQIVSNKIQQAKEWDFWQVAEEIVYISDQLSEVFEKSIIKIFGWENVKQ